MSSLTPKGIRLCWLYNRTIWQSEIDSLAARLVRSIRPYSVSSNPLQRVQGLSAEGKSLKVPQWQGPSIFTLPAGLRTFASQRIIETFEDLPSNYSVENGLPFQKSDISQAQAASIFGSSMTPRLANQILRYIHGRRVAGTLEDPTIVNPYGDEAFNKCLTWLREHVPVDEVKCAGLRAEQELAELEEGYIAGAERLGLVKPNTPNASTKGQDVYGEGVFDRVRKAREAKLDEEERLKKEQLEQAGLIVDANGSQQSGTLQINNTKSKVELQQQGANARLQHYIERATLSSDAEPPKMSAFARLWPSTLLTVAVVLGCILLAQVYTPPRREWRMWPDVPPSAATIIAIILANAIIMGAWKIPPAWRMLNKYFLSVPGLPHAFSIVGNVFSHQKFSHFSMNMIFLWFVGTRLHDEVGRGNFLAIYVGAGTVGSMVSLASWVLRAQFMTSHLGASGAVSGIIAAYLVLKGSDKVSYFGFPPEDWPSITATMLLMLLIGAELWGLRAKPKVLVADHRAHLGGYATGIAAGAFLRMRDSENKEELVSEKKGHPSQLMTSDS